MLDIMRKHASSWLIKVILAAIIITFIFFFGYSSYRQGGKGGRVGAEGRMAAEVNGIPISVSEFDFFFNQSFEQIKDQFKGAEIPDFARKIAESTTMQQLVAREVMLQQADQLKLVIPDDWLADTIRDIQSAQAGGEFDPIAYRHQFLPYFRSRFGMDYEEFVRQDLRIGEFRALFTGISAKPPPPSAEAGSTLAWIFESVAIDPGALVKSGALSSEGEARALADKLSSADPKTWSKILAPLKLKVDRVGPVSISERAKLLGGVGTMEDYRAVFSLTRENPTAKPIEAGGRVHVVKFIERTEPATGDEPTSSSGDFFERWMEKLLAKAKVRDFMAKGQ